MFRMAARNIKDNTSESVSEEQIKAVLRRSLDEVQYYQNRIPSYQGVIKNKFLSDCLGPMIFCLILQL